MAEVEFFEGAVHGKDLLGDGGEVFVGEVKSFLVGSFGVPDQQNDLCHLS